MKNSIGSVQWPCNLRAIKIIKLCWHSELSAYPFPQVDVSSVSKWARIKTSMSQKKSKKRKFYRSSRCSHKSMTQNPSTPLQQITQANKFKYVGPTQKHCYAQSDGAQETNNVHQHNNTGYNDLPPIACRRLHIIFTSWKNRTLQDKMIHWI